MTPLNPRVYTVQCTSYNCSRFETEEEYSEDSLDDLQQEKTNQLADNHAGEFLSIISTEL